MISRLFPGSDSDSDMEPEPGSESESVPSNDETEAYRYHFALDVNVPGSRRRALLTAYKQGDATGTNEQPGIDGDARIPTDVREQFRTVVESVLERMDASLLALRIDADRQPSCVHLAVETSHVLNLHRFNDSFKNALKEAYNTRFPDARSVRIQRVNANGLPTTIDDRFPLPTAAQLDELQGHEVDTLATAQGISTNSDRRSKRDGLLMLRAVDEQNQED